MRARPALQGLIAAPIVAALALGAASAPAGATPKSGTTAPLVVADVQTFSGATAAFGPEQQSGCLTAVTIINRDGGVMGHHLTCSAVDTRSDPVDSVPAVQKLVALTHHVVGAVGPSSNTASADVPLLTAAHIPMFSDTGQAEFTKTKDPYFYRILAADDAGGYAFAAWAKKAGYTRVAAVFANNVNAQGNVPSLIDGLKHLGIDLVINQALAPDQTSYSSEVLALRNADPQVIITTADPQTEATYQANLQQLVGKVLPIVGPIPAPQPDWSKAISSAIGAANYAKYYRSVHPYSATSGAAFAAYKKTLLTLNIPKPKQWLNDPYAQAPYDGVTTIALAMLEAKSTNPVTFNRYIVKVANGTSGAEVVHTFAQGKAAIAAGHKVRYEGIFQQIVFNRFHNSTSGFAVTKLGSKNTDSQVGVVTSADIAKASNG